MRISQCLSLMSLVTSTVLAANEATAQTRSQVYGAPLIQQAQTVYVRADAGMTTYESGAAGSKETQASTSYAVGAWAGENRVVGASLTSSTASVPFSLNDSTMRASFQDVRIMARFGWVIPSVGLSLSEVDVRQAGIDTVGLYATGINAGLALAVPLHTRLVASVEAMTVQSTKVHDKLGQESKLGRRDEIDGNLSFDVTDRMVDLLVGYRLRRYKLEIPSGEEREQSLGAYAGLRLGLYF